MNQTLYSNKYICFLLAFFSHMIINIGGEVSPSFLFILITFFSWKKYVNFRNDKTLRKFLKLFGVLLSVQLLWLPFAETDLLTQVKGVLVTVSGLIYFLYYYMAYGQNANILKWAFLGTFLASFVFINVLAERAGGEFGLWKFQIMPRLVSLTILVYLWFLKNEKFRKLTPLLFLFVGGLGLATGVRSTGLVPFVAGTMTMLVQRRRTNLKSIKRYAIVGGLVIYAAYAFLYVPKVLDGTITSGNSEQLKAVDNPYNPINLLIQGRTDAVVPFIAFVDNPITGWGYGTADPGLKYHYALSLLKSEDSPGDYDESTIPGHSVWGYYSCSYGIIVFFTMFLLIRLVWTFMFKSLVCNDEYLPFRIWATLTMTWNVLFSPMAHFKTMPELFAAIVVFSILALKRQNKKLL